MAVMLTWLLLCGWPAFSLTAAPDEWIAEKGSYLETAERAGGAESGSSQDMAAAAGRYVVRRGETLLSIAGRLGVSASDLVSMNNLADADIIRDGQVLLVPGSVYIHTVLPGENLSGIARGAGVPVEDIAAANGLEDQDLVLAGQKLLIAKNPEASGSVPAAVSRGLPVGDLIWPVLGWISSPFGMRDGRPHEGVDIAADHGAPIRAAMSGRVTFAGPRGGYGLTVILDHGGGLSTLYAHSSRLLVAEGQWVAKGDVIALVGNTGRSKGPHLHLELHLDGTPHDPLLCLGRMRA